MCEECEPFRIRGGFRIHSTGGRIFSKRGDMGWFGTRAPVETKSKKTRFILPPAVTSIHFTGAGLPPLKPPVSDVLIG